jgi:hypothetical protein
METLQVVDTSAAADKEIRSVNKAPDGWVLIQDFNFSRTNSTALLGTIVHLEPLLKMVAAR